LAGVLQMEGGRLIVTQQKTTLEVLDSGIRISGLEIPRKDVADYFGRIDIHERESVLVRAIEVGVFCLERANNNSDLEYVRRQVEGLLSRVEVAVAAIPEKTQAALIQQIGFSDGQVLAPIKGLISEATKTTTLRLNDVRDLLARDLDPNRETSAIGGVLHSLRQLLDVKRRDSVQATIENAVKSVTEENGALASAVRAVVVKALVPLEADLRELAKEVRGQEAAAEALDQTTAKGISYEEETVERLRDWASMSGAEVHHVGVDNQPGDIVIRIPSDSLITEPFVVAVETRDRQVGLGRKAISDILAKAMSHRTAIAGIYVSRSPEGLAKEIGDWAEGACSCGRFVACTDEHIVAALRWLILQGRLQAMRASAPEFDAASVEIQIKRTRTALDRVKSINRKVTEVRGSAQDIQDEAECLREEIRGAMSSIEDALRAAPARPEPLPVQERQAVTA
jgi:hypothetical protein